MKTLLLVTVLALILFACQGEGKTFRTPTVKYCVESNLIGGTVSKDTFDLYEGTKLGIDVYNGAYGLKVMNYYPLYTKGAYNMSVPFIKWGVVDFKVTNIIK